MKRKKASVAAPIGWLDKWEEYIIRDQIRKNSFVIESLIQKIDLLANRERCPKDANTLLKLRKRLTVSIEENDTFRKVLWKHQQMKETWRTMPGSTPDPIAFLIGRIKERRYKLIAQACMK